MPMPPVDAIAEAYKSEAGGDPDLALRAAIMDALADLTEWERRTRRAERLVSRGFARGRIGGDGREAGGVVEPEA